jgi:hypothetical protein
LTDAAMMMHRCRASANAVGRSCPIFALSPQQGAARRGKELHKAKLKMNPILPIQARDPAMRSNGQQAASYRRLFRLLTGGFLVRVQAEEPSFAVNLLRPPISHPLVPPATGGAISTWGQNSQHFVEFRRKFS